MRLKYGEEHFRLNWTLSLDTSQELRMLSWSLLVHCCTHLSVDMMRRAKDEWQDHLVGPLTRSLFDFQSLTMS